MVVVVVVVVGVCWIQKTSAHYPLSGGPWDLKDRDFGYRGQYVNFNITSVIHLTRPICLGLLKRENVRLFFYWEFNPQELILYIESTSSIIQNP